MNDAIKKLVESDKTWRGEPRKPKKNRCAKCAGPTEVVVIHGHKARACKARCGAVVGTVR